VANIGAFVLNRTCLRTQQARQDFD